MMLVIPMALKDKFKKLVPTALITEPKRVVGMFKNSCFISKIFTKGELIK
jgi:hypothetical protein